jgi:integrase/recombinase XerD
MKIEWRHFNKKAKTLEIIGKGNKRRVIDLSEDAYAFFISQPKILGSNLMFSDGTGAPFRGVGKELLKARRKATAKAVDEGRELIDFSLHPLRHDFAVKTLRSGKMGIYELSRHLGHTSVLTTEDNYLDYLTPSEAARIRQLDEAQQKTQARWLQRESAQRSAQQPEDEDEEDQKDEL